jgi:hypothetical protein
MKYIVSIITLLATLTILGAQKPIGVYDMILGEFHYALTLKSNGNFKYGHSFEMGSTSSTGKWKLNNDTIFLSSYQKPWLIEGVEEKNIDSLKNQVCIEVIYKSHATDQTVRDFTVWINGDCNMTQLTDSLGRIFFTLTNTSWLNIIYDDYKIKDIRSNYFVITLNTFPLWLSPPTLLWRKWVVNGNTISPVECDKKLDHIVLKKKE